MVDFSGLKTLSIPDFNPAREAQERQERIEAVKTYYGLTSKKGFSRLSPLQIKELVARRESLKPEPVILRLSSILHKYPESGRNFYDALDRIYKLLKIVRSGVIDKFENFQGWVPLIDYSFPSSKLISSPEIRFQPKTGLPAIEILLSPIDNSTGKQIFSDDFIHPAPIYVKGIQPWSESGDIQSHKIQGRVGTTNENQELFDKSKTL
jgi:hypothetical protein